jgi:hypothetical protein
MQKQASIALHLKPLTHFSILDFAVLNNPISQMYLTLEKQYQD